MPGGTIGVRCNTDNAAVVRMAGAVRVR
jgi:hypothetical protein